MNRFNRVELVRAAQQVAQRRLCSTDCSAGSVGAALVTTSGEVFTGICIDTACSLGFCAEHSAIAEMLKHQQTRIVAIVATASDGRIVPPCGRCRELIRQVDPENWNANVIVSENDIVPLRALLPFGQPAKPA